MSLDVLSCVLCGRETSLGTGLLWDPTEDVRYCANPTACAARRQGRVDTVRDHGRCAEHHKPAHAGGPISCARDADHEPPCRDLEGREWEAEHERTPA